jgi:uncharacterized protein
MASSPDAPSAPATDHGLSRRSVLTRSAAGLGIALSGSLNGLFGAETALAHDDHRKGRGNGHGADGPAGYGPLVPDPAGLLSLPAGFSYTIIARSGVTTLETGGGARST